MMDGYTGSRRAAETMSKPDWTDVQIGSAMAIVCGLGYGWLAVVLSQSHYGNVDNLAFDFDARLYLCTYVDSPMTMGGIKHPLIVLLRPLVQALIYLGIPPRAAAGLPMAAIGGVGIGLWYLFLRAILVARIIAIPFALRFAVSATQLFVSMIPEAYGPAGLALIGLWLLTSRRLASPTAGGFWRYVVAFATFGITITNVAQSFIAEFLIWLRNDTIPGAVRRTVVFGLRLSVLLALPLLVIWHSVVWQAVSDPVHWLKSAWWLQTFGEKARVPAILMTFLEYVTVAPDYVWVPIVDGWDMRDFRAPLYSPIGFTAVAGWSLLLACGLVCGLRDRGMRWLTAGMLFAFAFNVLLHTRFQFRLSLFIYTSHVLILVFGMAAGAARAASRHRGTTTAMGLAMLLLFMAVATNNLPVAAAFAHDFRSAVIPAPQDCSDYASGRAGRDGQQ
jgi:hypothetical protein